MNFQSEAFRLFDIAFYKLQLPELEDGSENCLEHYLEHGWKDGLDPSPLFSTKYYLIGNPDVAREGINPLLHYLSTGKSEDRAWAPSCFDLDYYVKSNLEGLSASENPVQHYYRHGRLAGWTPHPLFDVAFYRKQLGGTAGPRIDYMLHYLEQGWKNGLSPHPLFDVKHYQGQLDSELKSIAPLLHYLKAGWRQGLSPHLLFDPDYYVQNNDVDTITGCPLVHYLAEDTWSSTPHYLFSDEYYVAAADGIFKSDPRKQYHSGPPLVHYLNHGADNGVPTHPLFDARYYRKKLEELRRTGAGNPDLLDPGADDILLHYLSVGSRRDISPTPFFDPVFYRNQIDEEIEGDPFRHYLFPSGYGVASPHPAIDLLHYAGVASDFVPSDQPCILHLMATPQEQRMSPHPAFDADFYLNRNNDIKENGMCPILHFLEHGIYEGRSPNALFSHPYIHDVASRERPGFHDPVEYYFREKLDRRTRILFLGHDASRTGAPLILLNLIRHFSKLPGVECVTILGGPGPLADEFHKYSHAYVFENQDRGFLDWYKHSENFVNEMDPVMRILFSNRPTATICNSLEARQLADFVHRHGMHPIISLIHEAADSYQPKQVLDTLDLSDLVVFPSQYVLDRARLAGSLPEEKIIIRGQGLLTDHFGRGNRKIAKQQVCKELGIADDSRLVLGCGTINRRKGIDLFVDAACRLLSDRETFGNVHFVWLGDGPTHHDSAHWWARRDIVEHELEDRIHFIGARSDTERYYLASELFALTSRIDPFPCVVHEAMSCGLPIVAFEGSSGSPELARDSATVIPISAERLADAVGELLTDHKKRKKMSRRAARIIKRDGRFSEYANDIIKLANGITSEEINLPKINTKNNRYDNRTIYFATPDWSISGVNTFTETLVGQLNTRGFDAKILFTRGRHTFHLPNENDVFPRVPYQFLQPRSAEPANVWAGIQDYYRNERQPCIFVPNYDYMAASAAPCLPEHVRTVGIAHSDDAEHYEQTYRLGLYWDQIVCVSGKIREQVILSNKSFESKTSVIRYGVPFDDAVAKAAIRERRKRGPDEPIHLVYIGRFVDHQKKIMSYVKLARYLDKENIPFRLTMIGDGDRFRTVNAALEDLKAKGIVEIPGRLGREEIQRTLSSADVLLLLSDFEGLPLSILEALSVGCIPVVWDMESGIPEIVASGKNGFVITKNDFSALLGTLRTLQGDRKLLNRLAGNAYRSFGKHRLDENTMADRYAELFDQVFASAGKQTECRFPRFTDYRDGILPPVWMRPIS